MQPIRRRVEPGIYERLNAAGERLGFEIQYKDGDGRPRRRSVKGNIHAARDELAKARTRRTRQEQEPANPRMTLSAVLERYEAAVMPTLRPNSRAAYRPAHKRIRDGLGRKRISAINRADVRRFVAEEVAAGYKANTIRSHYSALRALFGFARNDLDIPVALPRIELPDPADDRRQHRVLNDDELARVLSGCPDRSRLFFRTVAETGCRASEGLGLTPQSVGDGTIRFARQLARDGSLRPLKTRQSNRTIEITRALSAELRLAGDRARVLPPFVASGNRAPMDRGAGDRRAGVARASDPRSAPHARLTADRTRLGPRRDRQAARRQSRDDPADLRPRVRRSPPRPGASRGTGGALRRPRWLPDGYQHAITDPHRRGQSRAISDEKIAPRAVALTFLMFHLRRPDVLAGRRPRHPPGGQDPLRAAGTARRRRAVERIAEPWRPHRTLACLYLWRSLSADAGG